MKKLLLVFLVFLSIETFAQVRDITISTNKTVSLVFPDQVIHVDRGTAKVLVQQVEASGNILLIKAGSGDLENTSLSVVTKGGDVYAFVVHLGIAIDTLVYHIESSKRFSIADYANLLLHSNNRRFSIKDKSFGILCRVSEISIKDDVIYLRLDLDNQSAIPFDIEVLRFTIKNGKRSKRTAFQEIEVVPSYTSENHSRIPAFTKSVLVLGFDKFTLPDGKLLGLQVMEDRGGRHLQLKIRNKHLVRANILPDLH